MRNPDHLRPFQSDQRVVLVAEDDVIIQNMVRLTLERDGYFVLTAHDGLEALALSRQFPGTIHLLLTDMMMPRMDGGELCRHMYEERPNILILVMSGTHHPGEKVKYLSKPFSPAKLRGVVAEMVGGAAPVSDR
jgi:CheY-like chemotaxis protein